MAFHFTETQRIQKSWVRLAFLPAVLSIGILLIQFVAKHTIITPSATHYGWFAVAGAVLLAPGLFLLSVRLTTHIGPEGVAYQFFPFHRKLHRNPWSDIRQAEVRKYSSFKEVGGWGLRFSRDFHTIAFSTTGTWALFLDMVKGGRILIGTQKPKAMREALEELKAMS